MKLCHSESYADMHAAGLDIIGELHEACHDGMVGSCQQLPVLQSSSLHEQCSTPLSEVRLLSTPLSNLSCSNASWVWLLACFHPIEAAVRHDLCLRSAKSYLPM